MEILLDTVLDNLVPIMVAVIFWVLPSPIIGKGKKFLKFVRDIIDRILKTLKDSEK